MSFLNYDTGYKLVPPEGLIEAKIAIVGEAPGKTEEEKRKPFVGASGRELDKLFHTCGLSRTDLYITNVIKERPENNDISKFIDLDRKTPYITYKAEEYLESLKSELSTHECNVIVSLGNTALWALTGKTSILKYRGSILESTLVPGKKVIPTIHPRAILPPTGVYIWRYWIMYDLKRAMEESLFPEIRIPEPRKILSPTFSDVQDFFREVYSYPIVDVDIEVHNDQISCIGFSYSENYAICIPFLGEHGDYWNIDQEAMIWQDIARLLENPKIIKRGQNFLFDVSFLLFRHGIRTTNCLDTMIAQGILYPDFPKGLDFITSVYTKFPYYKSMVKHGIAERKGDK